MKLLIIIALAFVIAKQGQIVKIIMNESDKLDADPLAYGAQKYGITECTCIIDANKSITFNQVGSKWNIYHQAANQVNYSINISEVLYGATGNN